ncbi:MAG TPA: hypothetical protein VJ044_04290, partial [Candidatus Hodarchaeales archaeon]|nr:hypothetical protein [Candidatus Hodarchaeales archaeon]
FYYMRNKSTKISAEIDHNVVTMIVQDHLPPNQPLGNLPDVAKRNSERNTIMIERSLTTLGLFAILSLIFSLLAVNIFVFGVFLPFGLIASFIGSEFRWYLAIAFYLGLSALCLFILIWTFHRKVFQRIIDQYRYRGFWMGFFASILITDKLSHGNNNLLSLAKDFEKSQPSIAMFLSKISFNNDQEFLALVYSQFSDAESQPTLIFPGSAGKLIQFYAYASIVAGLLADKLVEPIKAILDNIVQFLV